MNVGIRTKEKTGVIRYGKGSNWNIRECVVEDVRCITYSLVLYLYIPQKEERQCEVQVIDLIYFMITYAKMLITHANIVYLDSPREFVTVPVTNIKTCKTADCNNFFPQDENDFQIKKIYYCKYSDCDSQCEEDHEHYEYYKCFIFYLGRKYT